MNASNNTLSYPDWSPHTRPASPLPQKQHAEDDLLQKHDLSKTRAQRTIQSTQNLTCTLTILILLFFNSLLTAPVNALSNTTSLYLCSTHHLTGTNAREATVLRPRVHPASCPYAAPTRHGMEQPIIPRHDDPNGGVHVIQVRIEEAYLDPAVLT